MAYKAPFYKKKNLDFAFSPTRSPSPVKVAGNRELDRRPLVERIVHSLAVQPYTRDDLLSKLCGQGLRDCDRRIFKLTLQRVGLLRDGCFHLTTWKGVDACWPFYTAQEAQVVKKRKAQQSNPNKPDCLPLVYCSPKSVQSVKPVEAVKPIETVEPGLNLI